MSSVQMFVEMVVFLKNRHIIKFLIFFNELFFLFYKDILGYSNVEQ